VFILVFVNVPQTQGYEGAPKILPLHRGQ